MNTTVQKQNKDILSPAGRVGEIIIIVMMFLLLAFFVYHQATNTGFFTEKFRTLEMLCLYVPLLLAFSAPAIRAATGRRNPARLFEATTSLLQAVSALWMLIVFPYNFAHLADALPAGLHFLLGWVTDDIGRLVLLLQVIIGPLSAILNVWKYLSVRGEETDISLRRRVS